MYKACVSFDGHFHLIAPCAPNFTIISRFPIRFWRLLRCGTLLLFTWIVYSAHAANRRSGIENKLHGPRGNNISPVCAKRYSSSLAFHSFWYLLLLLYYWKYYIFQAIKVRTTTRLFLNFTRKMNVILEYSKNNGYIHVWWEKKGKKRKGKKRE